MDRLEVVGVAEVARIAGVTHGAVGFWRKRKGDPFPEPDVVLHMGPVWRTERVVEWLARNGKEMGE